MIELGVNVDHVATVRQARRVDEPDPVWAAALAELGGADQITIHLREDRRHIQDRDLRILRQTVATRLNLEMARTEEIISIALDVKPNQITLVPEKREEITTEGGLAVASEKDAVAGVVGRFKEAGLGVSLFIDPDEEQIRASAETGADAVELHTGTFANAPAGPEQDAELARLQQGATLAKQLGLNVAAGHGLNYQNIKRIVTIPEVHEVNIGHSIVARAVFVGIGDAVREMKALLC